jgi:hypothetical protein
MYVTNPALCINIFFIEKLSVFIELLKSYFRELLVLPAVSLQSVYQSLVPFRLPAKIFLL